MKNYALRFTDDDLYAALKKSAQKNRRSLNGEIMRAIDFYLKHAPNEIEAKPGKEAARKKSP